MLLTSSLEFDLPPELIAIRPAEPRDTSRLLVVSRSDPAMCEHRRFGDLLEYLRADDLMVFNSSSVLPARLRGRRADTGGAVSGLFLGARPDGGWVVMLQAGGRLREGQLIEMLTAAGEETRYRLRLEDRDGERWVVRVEFSDGASASVGAAEALAEVGATPLPPYILKSRRDAGLDEPDGVDRQWYQTVYADPDAARSVAAPTAGLHFTPEMLGRIDAMGVRRSRLHLHVGAGTFKPVQTEFVEDHPIHEEWFEVSATCMAELAATPKRGGRVVCVGTTSVRAIESLRRPIAPEVLARGHSGPTRLLITPGFGFDWTDALVTNFHLPRSTLLALVASLFPEGVERLAEIYRIAVGERYRFYSYGDAMLILP